MGVCLDNVVASSLIGSIGMASTAGKVQSRRDDLSASASDLPIECKLYASVELQVGEETNDCIAYVQINPNM